MNTPHDTLEQSGARAVEDRRRASTEAPRFIDARRRGFLKSGVALGSATVLGTAAGESLSTPDTGANQAKPVKAGYRLTDHVREYYARARI